MPIFTPVLYNRLLQNIAPKALKHTFARSNQPVSQIRRCIFIQCRHGTGCPSKAAPAQPPAGYPGKAAPTMPSRPCCPSKAVQATLLPPECRLYSPHRPPSRCVPPCIDHSGSGGQPLPAPLENMCKRKSLISLHICCCAAATCPMCFLQNPGNISGRYFPRLKFFLIFRRYRKRYFRNIRKQDTCRARVFSLQKNLRIP